MHITNVHFYGGASATQSKLQAARADEAASQPAKTGNAADPYAALMGKYDLQNITPTQIDRLADDLTEAGYPFNNELMMLRTRGADFQAHAGKFADPQFDPHEPGNLIQSVKTQISMARQYGGATDYLERFLDFLNRYDERDSSAATSARQGGVHESIMSQIVQNTDA